MLSLAASVSPPLGGSFHSVYSGVHYVYSVRCGVGVRTKSDVAESNQYLMHAGCLSNLFVFLMQLRAVDDHTFCVMPHL